jgi:hypothetical protein
MPKINQAAPAELHHTIDIDAAHGESSAAVSGRRGSTSGRNRSFQLTGLARAPSARNANAASETNAGAEEGSPPHNMGSSLLGASQRSDSTLDIRSASDLSRYGTLTGSFRSMSSPTRAHSGAPQEHASASHAEENHPSHRRSRSSLPGPLLRSDSARTWSNINLYDTPESSFRSTSGPVHATQAATPQERAATRQQQLVQHEALRNYSDKLGAIGAGTLEALGFGANTATTFGAGRTSGEQATIAAMTHMAGDHLTGFYTKPAAAAVPYATLLGRSVAGMTVGGIVGGVSSVVGQVLVAPAMVGTAQALAGGSRTFAKVPPEHIYPDPDPYIEIDGQQALKPEPQYQAELAQVAALRGEVAQLQNRYTVDGSRAMVSGSVAFDAAHAIRAALTTPTSRFEAPALLTRIALGTAASGAAGVATGASLALLKAHTTVKVQVGEQQYALPLFTVKDPNAATVQGDGGNISRIAMMSNTVRGAWNAFAGGRTGAELAMHVGLQVAERSAGIIAATVVNALVQPAATSVANEIDAHSDGVRIAANTVATVTAFTAAVVVWFSILPKIQAQQARPTTT